MVADLTIATTILSDSIYLFTFNLFSFQSEVDYLITGYVVCLNVSKRKFFLIGDLSETDMPHRRPIGDRHASSETHRRPIGDRHASSETHRRPTCLIGDPSETYMPYRRPTCLIGGRRVSSETYMPHRRPTCLIADRHASSETHKKYIACLI